MGTTGSRVEQRYYEHIVRELARCRAWDPGLGLVVGDNR